MAAKRHSAGCFGVRFAANVPLAATNSQTVHMNEWPLMGFATAALNVS